MNPESATQAEFNSFASFLQIMKGAIYVKIVLIEDAQDVDSTCLSGSRHE